MLSLKSEVLCSLTTSVTVMVVGIEASIQQLRHFVHLIMLDEVHELPQIGLHKPEKREIYYSEKKEQMLVGVREKSQDGAVKRPK